MRGRAIACAALSLLCAFSIPFHRSGAQTARTRDAGVAGVSYDNGLTVSALTLYEALIAQRSRSSTVANGVVSLFDDGRWSMQGSLSGTRFSPSVPMTRTPFGAMFRSMRGEVGVAARSSAQQGSQPTLELVAETRAHFIDAERGLWLGGGFARTFDGIQWRTSMLGDLGAWFRGSTTLVTTTFRPYQLQYGDLLADAETNVEWTRGAFVLSATSGIRLSEALRGTVAWAGLSGAFPLRSGMRAIASVGSYPTDLLQGLPGGRYLSLTVRLPNRRRTPKAPAGSMPIPEPTPVDAPGAIVLTFESGNTDRGSRVVRVRVAGAQRVELMADFTEWESVPLVRTPTGVWETTAYIPAGVHRLSVRIDGGPWIVPSNVTQIRDEFGGHVGMIVLQ